MVTLCRPQLIPLIPAASLCCGRREGGSGLCQAQGRELLTGKAEGMPLSGIFPRTNPAGCLTFFFCMYRNGHRREERDTRLTGCKGRLSSGDSCLAVECTRRILNNSYLQQRPRYQLPARESPITASPAREKPSRCRRGGDPRS